MRRPLLLAALLLVLAAALGAAAIILPGRGEPERARAQAQAEQAVRDIAAAEISLHAQSGAFQPFTAAEQAADRNLLGLPWRGFPIGDYAFEAEATPAGNLRIRAAPRPDAVMSGDAAGRFYVMEITPAGETAEAGWRPAQ